VSIPLWHVPLAGPCAVCGRPATRLEVYPGFRLVWHPYGFPCRLGNPPSEVNEVVRAVPLGVYMLPRSA
jgi:hypothetical protein